MKVVQRIVEALFFSIVLVTAPSLQADPLGDYFSQHPHPLVNKIGSTLNNCDVTMGITGWVRSPIGGGGKMRCSIQHPSGWTVTPFGEGMNSVLEDPNGFVSATLAGGVTMEIAQCTSSAIKDWWAQKIFASGFTNLQMIAYEEFALSFAGKQIPCAVFALSGYKAGVPLVGVYVVQTHSPGGYPCTLRVDGYGLPQNQIDQKLCVLSKIVNSIECQKGGGRGSKPNQRPSTRQRPKQGHQQDSTDDPIYIPPELMN